MDTFTTYLLYLISSLCVGGLIVFIISQMVKNQNAKYLNDDTTVPLGIDGNPVYPTRNAPENRRRTKASIKRNTQHVRDNENDFEFDDIYEPIAPYAPGVILPALVTEPIIDVESAIDDHIKNSNFMDNPPSRDIITGGSSWRDSGGSSSGDSGGSSSGDSGGSSSDYSSEY